MSKIGALKKNLADALDTHHAKETPTQAEAMASTAAVKAARKAVSDEIVSGAKVCPGCNNPPHGIEQPRSDGRGMEYEIGCIAGCKPFRHTNGTIREPRVRGGMLPKHAVDAWNEGPDHWLIFKPKGIPKINPALAAAEPEAAPAGPTGDA